MGKYLWVLVSLCLIAACGPDNNGTDNIKFEPDTGIEEDMHDSPDTSMGPDMGSDAGGDSGVDMTGADMGNGDAGTDMGTNNQTLCGEVACGSNEECRNEICFVVDSCAQPDDLGELSPDTPLMAEGNLATGADTIAGTCGNAGQKERVYRFDTTEQLQVSWDATWMGQFDGLVELRTACDDAGTVLSCSDVEAGSLTLDPGTYFLVLETRIGNAGDFSLELTAEAASCTPGTNECMGTQLQVCNDPTAPALFQCADSCANMLCGGDTCGNAIEVDAAGGGAFSGNGRGYSDDLNFDGNTGCMGPGGTTIDTPGYEVVFYLPGLQQNDIVSIDTETNDANINAIFILPACSDGDACTATFTDEQPDWVVDAAGDYYVIIDKLTASSTEFQYSVTVL